MQVMRLEDEAELPAAQGKQFLGRIGEFGAEQFDAAGFDAAQ